MRLNKTSDTVREMQEMLQRVHDEFPETSPLDARIDDLVELLENNSLTLDKLTQEERTNFLREVADGRLGKFITLWEPWWMQSIAAYESTTQGLRQSLIVALDGIDDESDDFDDDVALRHPIGLFTNTLESKLPPTIFDLHPSPNHEALECNLVDILFAYSFVMRMYNGDWRVDVLEAGALCISSSAVLQGKAHTNVLGQVVFACRAQTRIADADAAAKNAVLADVTSILGQRLFILDSLCDLLLLVESLQAEGASKKKKDLNRVAKKVEFQIVWAKDAATSMRFPRLHQQLIQAIDQATPTL
ncbi:hypothetical protein AeMF1_000800 [Aphanomyces euteiches]|nr:hypothetical protein AeMF1_000800 [Aphanomyces euteiches]